jgi:nodulation protein E
MATRIVVTGMGCVSALGIGCDAFQKGLFEGQCGIGPISLFDTHDCKVRIAGEVPHYDGKACFDKRQLGQLDRFAQFGVLSAREAVAQAGLIFKNDLAERTMVVHGTAIGAQNTQDEAYQQFYGTPEKRVSGMTIPKAMTSACVSQIGLDLGIKGPAFGTVSACASGGHAIAMAVMMLRSGVADVALAGGADAPLVRGLMRSWEKLRVLAKDTCRPFSKDRTGMVLAEGAGTLVLETLPYAQKRGATILAELVGFGMSSDAYSLVQPEPEGQIRAIQGALNDAHWDVTGVDYINAHATATLLGDPTETQAIRRVFGAHADALLVSASKSLFGHALGASPALEAIATIMAIREAVVPPTIGYLGFDPACDLDCVPNQARPMVIDRALSHSFAFGGLNTVLAFQKYGVA